MTGETYSVPGLCRDAICLYRTLLGRPDDCLLEDQAEDEAVRQISERIMGYFPWILTPIEQPEETGTAFVPDDREPPF